MLYLFTWLTLWASSGFSRDNRPLHFVLLKIISSIPPLLLKNLRELELPLGSFCLFHSALLHGSSPSAGEYGRTSMVARLVRNECVIPLNCAVPEEIFSYC